MTEVPCFEVIAGRPTEEELAALTVVLMGLARPAAVEVPKPVSGWAAHWRSVGAPPTPGPGAWTSTARR